MKNRIRIARGLKSALTNNNSNIEKDTNGKVIKGTPIYTTDERKLYISDGNQTPEQLEGINATGAEKLINISNGNVTNQSTTNGKLMYVDSADGKVKDCNITKGSSIKPIYMDNGEIKESDGTIGAINQPLYLNDGCMTALSDTVGGTSGQATYPVYLNAGVISTLTTPLSNNVYGFVEFAENKICFWGDGVTTEFYDKRLIALPEGVTLTVKINNIETNDYSYHGGSTGNNNYFIAFTSAPAYGSKIVITPSDSISFPIPKVAIDTSGDYITPTPSSPGPYTKSYEIVITKDNLYTDFKNDKVALILYFKITINEDLFSSERVTTCFIDSHLSSTVLNYSIGDWAYPNDPNNNNSRTIFDTTATIDVTQYSTSTNSVNIKFYDGGCWQDGQGVGLDRITNTVIELIGYRLVYLY